MTRIYSWLPYFLLPLMFLLSAAICFADQAPAVVDPSAALLSQAGAAIALFASKNVPWALKVSAVIMVVIASMKVDFINRDIWDHFGKYKALVAPLLGLIGGLLAQAINGSFSIQSVLAYMAAGSGAILLHEILDWVKAWPGIGPMYAGLIGIVENLIPDAPAPAPDAKA